MPNLTERPWKFVGWFSRHPLDTSEQPRAWVGSVTAQSHYEAIVKADDTLKNVLPGYQRLNWYVGDIDTEE